MQPVFFVLFFKFQNLHMIMRTARWISRPHANTRGALVLTQVQRKGKGPEGESLSGLPGVSPLFVVSFYGNSITV
jgi:hypothetical protein